MKTRDNSDTAEFSVLPLPPGWHRPIPFSSLIQAEVSGLTDPGRVRANNEDHFLIAYFGRFLDTIQASLPSGDIPLRSGEAGYTMVVADGMGGHEAGELASRLAVITLVNLLLSTADWILRTDDDHFMEEVIRRAGERFSHIHARLVAEGHCDPALRGLGTTLTAVVSLGKDLLVAHVGDSRVYRLRQGTLSQLTRDHTLAQELVDQGRLDRQEAAGHRLRHVLTRVLGGQGQELRADVRVHSLENGDCLLLCTDGLTDMVKEDTIATFLASDKPAGEVCRLLMDAALEAGGKDNVTVVVARYQIPPAS
jgi:serine/threonine protein phosphatase PrpC